MMVPATLSYLLLVKAAMTKVKPPQCSFFNAYITLCFGGPAISIVFFYLFSIFQQKYYFKTFNLIYQQPMEKLVEKFKKKESRFLYAIKNRNSTDKNSEGSIGPISSNFALALTKLQLGEDIRTIEGIILDQEKSKSGLYQLSFQLKSTVKINEQNALLHFPLNCIQISGKMILVDEDFRKFMTQFKTLFKSQDSDDQQFSDSNSNFLQNASQYRSSQISASQKGRGRPKGSKNRKKQDEQNSSDDEYLQTENKINQQKRGRGRPKGAKNKKKNLGDQLLNQTNLSLLFTNLFSNKSIQEINNRLLKLRQKQQYQANLIKKEQFQGKRGRGRPKGVRNKPKICNDESQSEQLVPAQNFPKRKAIKSINQLKCCSKCSQRLTKKLFIDGKNVPLEDLTNLGLNLGVQDNSNVILNVINQEQLLKKILSRKDAIQNQFIIPWQVNSKLQVCDYTIRTRKQHLVKSKRQGIYALVHDCYRYDPKWWKALTVQRILESLPNSPESIDIYKIITQGETELIREIFYNIPTLIRNGNQFLSAYLLENLVAFEENSRIYGYSKEHLDCLSKTLTEIHFRKSTMLKQNFTQNFCSPIHCAIINSNTQLLTYILKHITDFNVGDSLCRRPVHYAVMVDNPKNLELLVKYGADLKDIDKKKITPLMLAAKSGNYKIIKYILQKVRDAQYINFKSDEGLAAIHYTAIGRHQQCLYLFIEDQLAENNIQTKQGMNVLHLAAGTGQKDVVKNLLEKGLTIQPDNYRRTPLMLAIRNNHNDIFFNLFHASTKYYRRDFSHNTLLHYAAAYGNVEVLKYLLETKLNLQTPNKKNFYPYEIAVLKGHFQCAKILQNWNLHYNQHLIIKILRNPRGTEQFFQMLQYLLETKKYDVNYQLPNSYNYTALHYVCSISEDQYNRIRIKETSEMKQREFDFMQDKIIKKLLQHGADADLQNQRGQLAVNLCIQNQNMVGIKLLMKQIPFNLHTQTKTNNFIYYLANLTCEGAEQTRFVLKKLQQSDQRILRQQVKTKDWNGFSFLVYLVKRFVEIALSKFGRSFSNHFNQLKQDNKQLKKQQIQKLACLKAFNQYFDHQNAFIDLVNYLVQIGAEPKTIVVSPKMQKQHQNYRKWGIQHFLMKFPSPKLLKIFMKWIDTNFNMQNSQGRTPLHLFCKWNKDENIFNPNQSRKMDGDSYENYPFINYEEMNDYQGKRALQYLLEKGLTSNVLDINRSTPLLYSAINGQISFINLLRTFGSSINNVNLMNQIPLIQIIKKKNKFTLQDIQSIMSDEGANPDFKDLNQRNALHHLVSNAKNFDTSPEICKLLLQHGVSINSLDKFHRSPIFYCFIKIEPEQLHPSELSNKQNQIQNDGQNDKVQILQTLLNHQSIDLNVIDIYHRTPLHYACEKNFFFSILYLLDKHIDYDIMDNQGNTPLAICLKHRKLNQAALLVKKGVRYGHVIDQEVKHSYFSYAINNLSVGICFMLIDHGYPLQKALEQAPNQAFKNVLKKRYV